MYNFELRDVSKTFRRGNLLSMERVSAVDHVNLSIDSDEPWILSVVGESGSGKTTVARLILGLTDLTEGEINLFGEDTKELMEDKKEYYRNIQTIFQNPFTSFSSRRRVESYLFETALNLTDVRNRKEARERVVKVLEDVGLRYESVKGKYPNQFSGGELQRLSIARALIPSPKLIVADEPIAMVDASLKMNVVNIFKNLKNQYNICFIYITHDLSTAYYISDYVMTLYQGQLVEHGQAQHTLDHPAHPYTRLLLDSIPVVGKYWDHEKLLPNYDDSTYTLDGCRYSNRCPWAREMCARNVPELTKLDGLQRVACFAYTEDWPERHEEGI